MTIDTDRFRGLLLKQREHLRSTIDHHDIGRSLLGDEAGELSRSTADNHLADTASETYERELDEGLEDDAQEQLREVDEALGRVEAGSYGICAICGKEIPEERLEAVPWTKLCIDDARKQAR